MRHILGDGRRGRGNESISRRNLLLGIHDLYGSGVAASRHAGRTQEHGFEPQGPLVVWVDERSPSAIDLPDRRVGATKTAHIGHIAGAYVDPIFLGSDNPRGPVETAFLDDQWLRQKRLDRPGRNGGYRLRCQGLSVDARQKLYPFFCTPNSSAAAAGIAETQLRRRHAAVEDEDIPRGDVVRVSDLLLVHTPDFRPAPLIVEEFGGDAPKRIAPLDDVAVRRRILYLQIALCKHQQPRARQREC